MPLYEYECKQCKRHTEKIQKFSDPEITTCPFCGGALQRVITAPAIAFKGGGWYADGYGNAKPAAAGGDKSGGESGGSAAPSGEGTPAAAKTDAPASPAPSAPAPTASAAPAAASSDKK